MRIEQPVANERLFHPDASIVLVGCRGAGKRTLGFIGATYLRRRLITEDHFFESTTGLTRGAFLEQYGRSAFARRSAEVLHLMLDGSRTGCVIECGMGSLSKEAQRSLSAYCDTNPVVYVHREKERIGRLLNLDLNDADRLVRADVSHRDCTNLEYFNLYDRPGESDVAELSQSVTSPGGAPMLLRAKEDFIRFLDLITGQGVTRAWLESPFSIRAVPAEYRSYSYALRLRLSCFIDLDFDLEELEARADAVELVIDTWPEDSLTLLAKVVAQIRRKVGLPIVYHVEENPREEQRRPQHVRDDVDKRLLLQGLRLGVEYISVDLERNQDLVTSVLRKRGRSKVMGNYWNAVLGAPAWTDSRMLENYSRGQTMGCSLLRMSRFCAGDSPDENLVAFRKMVDAIPQPRPPLVAYDFSVLGVHTPLQSRIMNPVKHAAMKSSGREFLATVSTCCKSFALLFSQGKLDALQFYTLGSDVLYSVSPAMHRAAYDFSGMPHTFEAHPCSALEDLVRICSAGRFGGASLTAPFKEVIMPFLTLTSKHARAIGAVNTILPLRGNSASLLDHVNARNKAGLAQGLYGDNTDWSSIASCLRRAVSPRNHIQPASTTCLVVGAGGMARAAVYALIQLGARHIFIHNRTAERAETVAAHFNSWAASGGLPDVGGVAPRNICTVMPSLDQPWPEGYAQPTVIVSCVPATSMDSSPPANFVVPESWLLSRTGGVVVELAYEPRETPLVTQIRSFRASTFQAWVLVDGLDVVAEMATEAFELMTGRPAPCRLMREVCKNAWAEREREKAEAAAAVLAQVVEGQGVGVTKAETAEVAVIAGPVSADMEVDVT